jgi:hypothetical protein
MRAIWRGGAHFAACWAVFSIYTGKYYAVHVKIYCDFEKILKFKLLLRADVECCNFLVEKSDTKCLFLQVRYQGAASLCTIDNKNLYTVIQLALITAPTQSA